MTEFHSDIVIDPSDVLLYGIGVYVSVYRTPRLPRYLYSGMQDGRLTVRIALRNTLDGRTPSIASVTASSYAAMIFIRPHTFFERVGFLVAQHKIGRIRCGPHGSKYQASQQVSRWFHTKLVPWLGCAISDAGYLR